VATFTIKGKPGATLEGESIVLGTSSQATYALSDPFCAAEHCRIGGDGATFWIEDLGSSMGTFVNGAIVEKRHVLQTGDEVVVGASRLTATIKADKGEIEFKIGKPFYYESKVDNLALAKKEVSFGRFKSVRIGNWLAVLAGLLFLPLVILPGSHEAIMEPADTWHHGGPYRDAYLAELAQLPEGEQDCNACHSSFSVMPNTKGTSCMKCHEDDVNVGHHPFGYGSPDDWEVACYVCHVDHRGTGEGDLITIAAIDSCGMCHDADLKLSEGRTISSEYAPLVDVALRYDTFSHADHFEKASVSGEALDCSSCHTLLKEGETAKVLEEGGRAREFKYVDYQSCMSCHDAEKASPEKKAAVTFVADWHGVWEDETNQQKCLECHSDLWKADLKMVAHTPRDYLFEIDSQPHHGPEFENISGPNACKECHRNGEELAGQGRKKAVFEHATHVWDARPTELEAMQRISGLGGERGEGPQGDCMQCHQAVVDSHSLGNAETISFSSESCAECHKPNDTLPMPTELATLQRVDFPHDLPAHQNLGQGCFACHPFGVEDQVITINPVTSDLIKNCAECHGASAPEGTDPRLHPLELTAHANVGGRGDLDSGSCHQCHRAGDPSFFGPDAPEGIWKRHTDPEFRHLSRGHRDMTREGKCVDCHGQETWEAGRIRDVPVLREDAPMCRECHVKQKQQFHWR
jgi:FHA domain/Outer membrane cytochrome MtrC/MtrF-like, domains II/IV